MEVILLERVAKLGQIGDVVRVKDGFARNYLLRKGKALRATKENRSRFENMRVELEARNLEQKKDAEKIARKLDGQSFTVLRQAAEGGQLYGSVSPRDIAVLVTEAGFVVSRGVPGRRPCCSVRRAGHRAACLRRSDWEITQFHALRRSPRAGRASRGAAPWKGGLIVSTLRFIDRWRGGLARAQSWRASL